MAATIESLSLNGLWSLLLSHEPSNDDLLVVLFVAPPLRVVAAQELLNRGPVDNHYLRSIIRLVPQAREKATRELLEGEPTTDDLYCISRYVPALEAEVWQRIKEQRPSKEELNRIIEELPVFRSKAWRIFLPQATEKDLRSIFDNVPSLRAEAAQRLFEQWPTVDNLFDLMMFWPPLMLAAWRKLLELGFGYEEFLLNIFKKMPSLREEVWRKLLELRADNKVLRSAILALNDWSKQEILDFSVKEKIGREILKRNPTNDDLCFVIEYIPALRKDAWSMLSERIEIMRLEPSDSDIENISSIRRRLYFFIREFSDLKEGAARKLLSLEPAISELCLVLEDVPAMREEVASMILGKSEKIPENCLRLIIQKVPSFREQASIRFLEQEGFNSDNLSFIAYWVPIMKREIQILLSYGSGRRQCSDYRQESIDRIIWAISRKGRSGA